MSPDREACRDERGSEAGLGSRRRAAYRISARAPTRRQERGRTPRRTPPIFTRAALPAEGGHRSAWVAEGVSTEAEASASRPRRGSGSEFHPSQAVDPDHEVCRDDGGEVPSPVRRPWPSRVSGGAVAEAGAVSRVAQRAARGRKRWRVEGVRASRIPSDAKRSEDLA